MANLQITNTGGKTRKYAVSSLPFSWTFIYLTPKYSLLMKVGASWLSGSILTSNLEIIPKYIFYC